MLPLPQYADWFMLTCVAAAVSAVPLWKWWKSRQESDDAESWDKFNDFMAFMEKSKTTARGGITLLEVLVSIFILSIGLLGVAALIPIGKLYLVEVEKSDRTGACGRAAIRDIQVRKMLGFNSWSQGPAPGQRILPQSVLADAFVVDPLGHARGLTGNMGPLPRLTLLVQPSPMPPAPGVQLSLPQAEKIFLWGDDLVFTKPDDGGRPQPVVIGGEHQCTGNFTWFFTVVPSINEAGATVGNVYAWLPEPTPLNPFPKPIYPPPPLGYDDEGHLINLNNGERGRLINLGKHYNYSISVAVCYKRDYAAGETVIDVTGFPGGGYGGGSITIATPIPNLRNDMWVMLVGLKTAMVLKISDSTGIVEVKPRQVLICRWYRVVSVANQLNPPMLSLIGPDWDLAAPSPATPVKLVFVDSVTGVYSAPMVAGHGLRWD